MPFINLSEATKRSKDQKINGESTNATNRTSRVWPFYFIYHQNVTSIYVSIPARATLASFYFLPTVGSLARTGLHTNKDNRSVARV